MPDQRGKGRLRPKAITGFGHPVGDEDMAGTRQGTNHLSVAPAPGPAPSGGPGRGGTDQPAAAPHPAVIAGAEPVTGAAAGPGELAEADAGEELGDLGTMVRQATVLLRVNVRARFTAYQRRHGGKGAMPNTQVVFDALNACRHRYHEIMARRRPAAEPGLLFDAAQGRGRRTTTDARPSSQLSFRPTHAQLGQLKQIAEAEGAPSVSAFVDAVLDAWLPQRRRSRTNPGR